MNPSESSIVYLDAPPASAPAAAVRALEPFGPRWCEHHGDLAVLVPRAAWFDAAKALRTEGGYGAFVDHTAVDYPARGERFTVVVVLVNRDTHHRIVLKTRVPDGEAVASLVPLWKAADWAERETYDMFGIPFTGHPDLTRIYLPSSYEGWPLRRDFPLQGHLRFRD